MIEVDLPKSVDKSIKVHFLGKRTQRRQPVLSWALSRGTQHPEGIEQRDIKLTRTEHYLAHQHSEFVTSPVYVRIRMNVAIKRMRKQCVPGALSPPPPLYLGTRLLNEVKVCMHNLRTKSNKSNFVSGDIRLWRHLPTQHQQTRSVLGWQSERAPSVGAAV